MVNIMFENSKPFLLLHHASFHCTASFYLATHFVIKQCHRILGLIKLCIAKAQGLCTKTMPKHYSSATIQSATKRHHNAIVCLDYCFVAYWLSTTLMSIVVRCINNQSMYG